MPKAIDNVITFVPLEIRCNLSVHINHRKLYSCCWYSYALHRSMPEFRFFFTDFCFVYTTKSLTLVCHEKKNWIRCFIIHPLMDAGTLFSNINQRIHFTVHHVLQLVIFFSPQTFYSSFRLMQSDSHLMREYTSNDQQKKYVRFVKMLEALIGFSIECRNEFPVR